MILTVLRRYWKRILLLSLSIVQTPSNKLAIPPHFRLSITDLFDEVTKCISRQWQTLKVSNRTETISKFKVHANSVWNQLLHSGFVNFFTDDYNSVRSCMCNIFSQIPDFVFEQFAVFLSFFSSNLGRIQTKLCASQ